MSFVWTGVGLRMRTGGAEMWSSGCVKSHCNLLDSRWSTSCGMSAKPSWSSTFGWSRVHPGFCGGDFCVALFRVGYAERSAHSGNDSGSR